MLKEKTTLEREQSPDQPIGPLLDINLKNIKKMNSGRYICAIVEIC